MLDLYSFNHASAMLQAWHTDEVWITYLLIGSSCYDGRMKKKEPVVQVRIYQKEHAVLRRLAFRKNTTVAEIIRRLIKGS
jgi:hypothetical protein